MDTRLVKTSADQRLMEWAQLVSECRNSELTRKEWCAQHGITERKYHYWQKRVFDMAILQRETAAVSTAGNDHEPQFAELPAPQEYVQEPSAVLAASIQLGRATVNLYSGADAKMVQTICQALKTC